MPLATNALLSVEELKEFLPSSGTGKDSFYERIINRASDMLESLLDRQIVSRGALTEYHTFESTAGRVPLSPFSVSLFQAAGVRSGTDKLYMLEWPIISVTTIHEDLGWPRTYGTSALLVDGTDYQVVKPKGLIRRYGTGGPQAWAGGVRAVRVVYTAGYASAAVVPERIKGVALRLAALLAGESDRKVHGIVTQTDAMGNFTRFGPATITKDMERDLYDERRHDFSTTGERDL